MSARSICSTWRLIGVMALSAASLVPAFPARATPQPVLVARPTSGVAPLDVSFDTTGSRDSTGLASWELVFGDGATAAGVGAPPKMIRHNYAVAGTYLPSLRLRSTDGTTAEQETNVVVRRPSTVEMFRYVASHTGVAPQTVIGVQNVGALRPRWQVVTGARVFSSVALAGGVAYFGSQDGRLRAVSENTGASLWSRDLGSPFTHTPAVADGSVFIGSKAGSLWRLDAVTGAVIWRIGGVTAISSPVVGNGFLALGVAGPAGVLAVRLTDGAVLWRTRLSDLSRSTPAVADDRVFVTDFDGYVRALDAATGNVIWTFLTNPNPCPTKDRWRYVCGGIYSSPAVVGGKVYFGARDNNVYALDAATGVPLWSYPVRGFHVESSPAVAGGSVYVGGNDRYVYALDAATGTLKWDYRTGSAIDSSPTYTNGVVLIGSNDHFLYAFDAATGAVLLRTELSGRVQSSPVVADGMVFVGAGSTLHALETTFSS